MLWSSRGPPVRVGAKRPGATRIRANCQDGEYWRLLAAVPQERLKRGWLQRTFHEHRSSTGCAFTLAYPLKGADHVSTVGGPCARMSIAVRASPPWRLLRGWSRLRGASTVVYAIRRSEQAPGIDGSRGRPSGCDPPARAQDGSQTRPYGRASGLIALKNALTGSRCFWTHSPTRTLYH